MKIIYIRRTLIIVSILMIILSCIGIINEYLSRENKLFHSSCRTCPLVICSLTRVNESFVKVIITTSADLDNTENIGPQYMLIIYNDTIIYSQYIHDLFNPEYSSDWFRKTMLINISALGIKDVKRGGLYITVIYNYRNQTFDYGECILI